tara:strand:+ start:2198 stop:2380 length:183 start_codon:yes stop_codon:yes gene_type:complete
MLALYTEAQLGAAYQIYVRIHAECNLEFVDFDTYRTIFETQFAAMAEPDEVFNGLAEDVH